MSQSRRHRQDPWLSGSIDTWDVSWRSDGDFISSDRSVLFFLHSPIAQGPPQPQGSRQVGANHIGRRVAEVATKSRGRKTPPMALRSMWVFVLAR